MTGLKGKSGGAREGAGRPKLDNPKPTIQFRIDVDLLDFVNSSSNRSKLINECIRNEKNRRIK